ncbi:hypothetical protein [Paenibacillus alkalitolerans]|uniref:hypothetical protein n=1 Tax=Paenibacillus alkalitolerans TaxID=2799335 RepID=UPI0018F29EB2|nr:hypothetical protein [Paenibacillus alkalitolerans]
MKLQYKGVNNRSGRVEWVELDLASPFHPEGVVMEEWHVNQYRTFVEGIQSCIGRDLTKEELKTVQWLAGYEKSTTSKIMGIIKSAYDNGKQNH